MGVNDLSHKLYIVDMGLVKRVIDLGTQKHIPFKTGKDLTGTASYASINAHLGRELSRRDDLEAVAYVLVYFLKGKLPWQNAVYLSKSEKYKQIKQMKQTISVAELTKDCPH